MSNKQKIIDLILTDDEANTRLAIQLNEATNSFRTLASFIKKYKDKPVPEFKIYKMLAVFRKEAKMSTLYEFGFYTLIDVLSEDFELCYKTEHFVSWQHLPMRLSQGLTLTEYFHCTTRTSRIALKEYKIQAKCKLYLDFINF
jgi:hypothetical protein